MRAFKIVNIFAVLCCATGQKWTKVDKFGQNYALKDQFFKLVQTQIPV